MRSEVSGVRNSCATVATRSFFSSSKRSRRVTSCRTMVDADQPPLLGRDARWRAAAGRRRRRRRRRRRAPPPRAPSGRSRRRRRATCSRTRSTTARIAARRGASGAPVASSTVTREDPLGGAVGGEQLRPRGRRPAPDRAGCRWPPAPAAAPAAARRASSCGTAARRSAMVLNSRASCADLVAAGSTLGAHLEVALAEAARRLAPAPTSGRRIRRGQHRSRPGGRGARPASAAAIMTRVRALGGAAGLLALAHHRVLVEVEDLVGGVLDARRTAGCSVVEVVGLQRGVLGPRGEARRRRAR